MQHREILQSELRGLDGDLYLCHLFAPASSRDGLLILYRLYADIARIPYDVSDPMIGAIRLQWWRDMLDGLGESVPLQTGGAKRQGAPIMEALHEWQAGRGNGFDKSTLLRLIDGRESALGGGENASRTFNEIETEARCVGPALMQLSCSALNALNVAPTDLDDLLMQAGTGFELMRLVSAGDDIALQVATQAHEKLSTAATIFNALPRGLRKKLLPVFLPIGLAKRHAQAYPRRKSLLAYQLVLLKMAFIGKI